MRSIVAIETALPVAGRGTDSRRDALIKISRGFIFFPIYIIIRITIHFIKFITQVIRINRSVYDEYDPDEYKAQYERLHDSPSK